MRALSALCMVLFALAIAASTWAAPASSIPLALYTELANNAQSAKGVIHVSLAPGTTIMRIPGIADAQWIVPSTRTAAIEFTFTKGQWVSLRINFSDWIEVFLRENTVKAKRQKISAIVFKDGRPDDYFDDGGSPIGLSFADYPEVRSHLRVPNGPASLLLGTFFAGMEASPSPLAHGLSPAALSIQSGAGDPGVAVDIKAGALLPFSLETPGDTSSGSWIRLASLTAVPIARASFIPIESVIQFQSHAISTKVAAARLDFGDTILMPAGGCSLSFESLAADSTKSDAALNVPAASLVGPFAAGTRLQVTRNALGATIFTPQPDAVSRIERFAWTIRKTGAATLAAGNIEIPLAGQSASMVFDHVDALNLSFKQTQNPALTLESAVWSSGQLPLAKGRLSAFEAALSGGVLSLDRSRLQVLRGTVASSGLAIGDPLANSIAGDLRQLTFSLDQSSTVDAGNGAQFTLNSGTASAAGAAKSLSFDPALDGPTGTIAISDARIQTGLLRFGDQALLAVGSDNASYTATRTSGGTGWSLSGDLAVSTGTFLVNTVGRVLVEGGSISVANLALSNMGATGGSVSVVDLAIAPQSVSYGNGKLSVVALGTSRLRFSQGTLATVGENGNLSASLSLWIPILNGAIRFGSVGVVNLSGGSINFVANASTDLTATLSIDLDVEVSSGQVQILPGSEILLGKGTIIASALAGSPDVGFVGPLAQADVEIQSAAFSFSNGLRFSTTSGRFTANAAFKISKDGHSFSGPFSLKTGLDKLQSSANAGLTVSGGDLDLELQIMEDQTLTTQTGVASYFRGAGVQFQTPKGDSAHLTLSMENVRLNAPPHQPAVLKSNLRGRVDQFHLAIATEPKEGYHDKDGDHNDARFFSLTMTAALDPGQPSTLSVDDFTLTAGQPVPPLKPTVHFLLTLPPGDGEHPNSSIHEAGNHGGPDRMQNAQEAFTDTYPACRIHLYFFPGTYQLTAALDLSPVWSGGKVQATDISLTPPITRNEDSTTRGWDRDGCDSFLYKAVIVGFVSLIGDAIAGPIGGLALGTIGLKLINFEEGRLDNWINAQVASRIQSLQFSQQ